ncbi:hypothetical protein [Mycobacteroides salmoniphilum]|uniref:hypothetical protein n=1 Tax=Mycobacteroides salmoniphilum TaxID=404941 RepID=UPI0010658609|nr:hypothetical protein [Mycobacteroides salmoniphilum]
MTAPRVTVDPASRSVASWRAVLGNLKLRGAPDTHPQVIEARQGLAFHRARKAIDAEAGLLSAPAVDRLRAALGEAVAQ